MQRKKILIVVVGVLLVFSLNIFQEEVRGFFHYFSSPIQKTLWAAGSGISDFFGGIFRKSDLITENRSLRLENQELLAQLETSRTLREENKLLREAVEIGLAEEFDLAFAAVTAKDATQDLIRIDKGSLDGLAEGMAVITERKVLIGKISEVQENSAAVLLISHKESSCDAEISGKDAEGLVTGRGGQKIYLELIPRDKSIDKGDVIVSSSLGGVYPRGLLIGSIVEVQKDDVKPFQQAEAALFFKLRELKQVFIILK